MNLREQNLWRRAELAVDTGQEEKVFTELENEEDKKLYSFYVMMIKTIRSHK